MMLDKTFILFRKSTGKTIFEGTPHEIVPVLNHPHDILGYPRSLAITEHPDDLLIRSEDENPMSLNQFLGHLKTIMTIKDYNLL